MGEHRLRTMHALRGQGELRGIEATRPLCGIQRGGNRKSQRALARSRSGRVCRRQRTAPLCEFPGRFRPLPPKSPKNPITPLKTSRDTLHPGTGAATLTIALQGTSGGRGYDGERKTVNKKMQGRAWRAPKVGSPETSGFWWGLGQSPKKGALCRQTNKS